MPNAPQYVRHAGPEPARARKRTRTGLDAVKQWADQLDPEPEHARYVRKLARLLFEQTRLLHALGRPELRLLEAAALLHDTGLRRGADRHHKHSRDIILALELPGFTEEERAVIACIARYHRRGPPQSGHRVYRDLSPEMQGVVKILAAILRIADGLDRTHQAATRNLRITLNGDSCRIWVTQNPVSQVDLWGGMRKRGLFEAVFGVRVEVAPEAESPPAAGER